jgi:hypothetical protein
MDAGTGQAHVFMPKLSAREVQYEGGNWLDEPEPAKRHGVTSVQPLSGLQEFLAGDACSIHRRCGCGFPSGTR